MGWIDLPADETTDWSKREFVAQFWQAVRERYLCLPSVAFLGNTVWKRAFDEEFDPANEVPVDVQAISGVISEVPGNAISPGRLNEFSWYWMQRIIERDVLRPFATPVGWINHLDCATDLDGLSVGAAEFTYENQGSTVVMDSVRCFDLDPVSADNVYLKAGLNPLGFTRKHPREISSVGDPGEAGWVAALASGGFGSAEVYEHDGTSWALAADQHQLPDVVTEYGLMEAGDYIGPWIFNELQAVLNLLKYVSYQTVNTQNSPLGPRRRLQFFRALIEVGSPDYVNSSTYAVDSSHAAAYAAAAATSDLPPSDVIGSPLVAGHSALSQAFGSDYRVWLSHVETSMKRDERLELRLLDLPYPAGMPTRTVRVFRVPYRQYQGSSSGRVLSFSGVLGAEDVVQLHETYASPAESDTWTAVLGTTADCPIPPTPSGSGDFELRNAAEFVAAILEPEFEYA